MSDKAQAMIEELVSAAVAFGREKEPDWQTRIEKARSELKAYMVELEAENNRLAELLHNELSSLEIATDPAGVYRIPMLEVRKEDE